jgi:hypothetical protein
MYAGRALVSPTIYGRPAKPSSRPMSAKPAPCATPGCRHLSMSRRSARSRCRAPDAGEFLDRVYTNMFSTLPVGKARYGLMLREDGLVLDDGTTWRLGAHEFLMTTTTANAGKVMQHLEYYAST